jgi:hypothetical protein
MRVLQTQKAPHLFPRGLPSVGLSRAQNRYIREYTYKRYHADLKEIAVLIGLLVSYDVLFPAIVSILVKALIVLSVFTDLCSIAIPPLRRNG